MGVKPHLAVLRGVTAGGAGERTIWDARDRTPDVLVQGKCTTSLLSLQPKSMVLKGADKEAHL